MEAGADMKFIQELLGHDRIQITSDVYSHILKKIELINIEQYEEYTKTILQANQKTDNNFEIGGHVGAKNK